jgi:hypothetical protein
MGIIQPRLSPGKGRWPRNKKNKEKRILHRRYLLNAAKEYKKAANRRAYGTLGAASAVRHIDPSEYKIKE